MLRLVMVLVCGERVISVLFEMFYKYCGSCLVTVKVVCVFKRLLIYYLIYACGGGTGGRARSWWGKGMWKYSGMMVMFNISVGGWVAKVVHLSKLIECVLKICAISLNVYFALKTATNWTLFNDMHAECLRLSILLSAIHSEMHKT